MTNWYSGPLARLGGAFAAALLWCTAVAQPACSIQLGNDTTICQGQTVTLSGPPGFPNYLWSNGATSQNITVGESGNYNLQVSYPTGNVVTNGNFSGGNTGFTTMFNYNSTLTTDGNYWIGNNAAVYHPQWLGTGNGPFMLVNAGWMHPGFRFWCQTQPVCPGQTYTISFRAMSLANAGNPTLAVFVNNAWTGVDHILPAAQGVWANFSTTYTAPPGVTSADFCIQVSSGHGIGNDFGFDDVSISSTVVLNDAQQVTVTPLPVFDLGPNATVCTGQSLVLDAAVAGGTYLWQDGSTASSYNVTGPGNYNVTVTANNCSASDAITVNYNPTPAPDLGPNLTLCTGESILLNAGMPGASYMWQNGSMAATQNVTGPGTYSVTVILAGCVGNDAVDIAYNPIPIVNLGADQQFCFGGQTVLDATAPGATYVWNDGSTGPTLTATTSGTYDVDVTVNGCTGTDAVNVSVVPLPVVDIGADLTVCPGTDVTLDATAPGGSYLWSDGSTGPTLTTDVPGNYSVTVTVNGCSSSDAMVLANHVLPVFSLGADQTVCAGQMASFGVNVAGASYMWSTGSSAASITPSAAGIYWVDVTTNGCTVRDSAEVFVTPLPVVQLGNDYSICPGTTTTLDVTTPGASYLWSNGATTPSISVGPGIHSVTMTVNGCTDSDAITIGTHPAASVSLGPDVTLCPGDDLLLDVAQAGASYLWHDGSNASSYLITSAGPVSVQLTDVNGCVATDAMNAVYASPTPIDLGPDAVICQGDQLTLDANVIGASYLWSTGEQTPTIDVSTAGIFSVVVTQGSCTVNDEIDVSVVVLPVADLGGDQTLCPGDAIVLDATTPGVSYLWSTGAVTPSITVSNGGTYSVTLTNGTGCTATDAVDIVAATPGAVDLGPDLTLCQGQNAVLDAALPGASYNWSTGATTPTITVSSSGSYSVDVTQGSCMVSDQINVVVNIVPTVALGSDITLCAGDDMVFDATYPGATYSWSTGETTPFITVNSAATYSVTVDLNGCTASDAVDVGVLSLDAIDLGPDATLCAGQTITLDATMPGVSYMWSTGAQTPTITVGSTGNYAVTANQGACSVSDAVQITVNPMPQVDLGNDLTLCEGDDVVLDATYPGATYAWSTGAATPDITVSNAATYSVTVDLNGCVATDAIDVGVFAPGTFDLGSDVQLCAGDQVVYALGIPGASYLWSTGAVTSSITVTTTSTIWVQVQQSVCTSSDTVDVNVLDPGSFDLGDDITVCEGTPVLLDATVANASYMWNTGATSAQLNVTSTGSYSVTATVAQCSITDDVDVTIVPLPVVEIGGDQSICPGGSASFDATVPGASYLWQDGSTASTYTGILAEAVSVIVTVNGCSASDAAAIAVLPAPIADLGNDTTLCEGAALLLDVTQAGASYQWSNGGTSGTQNISTPGIVGVTIDLNGCVATDEIMVDVFDMQSLDLGPDQLHCPGVSTTLSTGIIGGTQTWSTGGTGSTITVSQGGSYWAQVQVAACVVRDTILIAYVPLVAPDLGDDVIICAGDSAVLQVEANGASIAWNDGSTADSLLVSATGDYTVTLSMQGCVASDVVEVTVLERVDSLSLGADSTYCPEQPLVLDATIAGANYVWNTGASTSFISVDQEGTYSVHATGMCIDAQASITVSEGSCDPLVFVPNAFTPNGDDDNEVFQVSVYGHLRDFSLMIFDRWGLLVHASDDASVTWDGTFHGEAVPDGVYVWKVRYRTMTDAGAVGRELIGHVTVLR